MQPIVYLQSEVDPYYSVKIILHEKIGRYQFSDWAYFYHETGNEQNAFSGLELPPTVFAEMKPKVTKVLHDQSVKIGMNKIKDR